MDESGLLNVSPANENSGSQTGSQRPDNLGYLELPQAIITAADGTSGHIQRLPRALRKCLLSSRSRVRVAVGALLIVLVRALAASHSGCIVNGALCVVLHTCHTIVRWQPRIVRVGPSSLTVLRVRAARGRAYGAPLTPEPLPTLRA
jgi:hypothetical protein